MSARLLVLALALPLLLGADDKKEELKEFTPKEGGFSVLLPDTPKKTEVPIKTPDGKSITQVQYAVDLGKGAYLVSYQDNPHLEKATDEKRYEALTTGRKKVEEIFQGKLLKEEKIKLDDKHPGLFFEVDMPKLKGIYRCRMYLVGGRLYQVIALGEQEVATSKDANRFLESFRLTK
jgi:hypothetical protein